MDPSFEWGITRVTPLKFERVLSYLRREAYQSISLRTLCQSTKLPQKPVILTFDDAYENILKYAFPLMQSYGYTGTLFVVSGYVGKWNDWDVNLGNIRFRHLSWRQLEELSRYGFEIGSHSVHHPDLTRVDKHRIIQEVNRSKREIENRLGMEIGFIAFPFGRYNASVISHCRSAGYSKGCGYWLRHRDKKMKETFVLERKPIYLFEGVKSLKSKLRRDGRNTAQQIKLRLIHLGSYGSSLLKTSECSFERE